MILKQVATQIMRLFLALALGNIIGLATFAFFAVVSYALKVWELEITTDFVSFSEVNYSLTLGAFMLGGSLIAGFIYSRLEGPRSHGPADLMVCIKKDELPNIKAGFITSFLTMVSVSSGSSVGSFGPIMHSAGSMAASLERFSKVVTRGIIFAAGGAAGIVGVFGAPLAAVTFAFAA